jgi:hypothetical protein
MDIANLATVICPSILYSKGANAARDESFLSIRAVQELMEASDDFYTIPDELLFVISENVSSIFAKEIDLPPKEIHKHCSKYMQARQPNRVPNSASGQVRDRPSDSRLSVYRSDNNLAASADGHVNGSSAASPYRPSSSNNNHAHPHASSHSNQSHHSQLSHPVPVVIANQSRPTSWIQGQHSNPGSQQSIHQVNSPGSTGWRGPFQGSANGSRQSSRGSAPSSPGPEQERRSFQADRERSWTPVQHDHR